MELKTIHKGKTAKPMPMIGKMGFEKRGVEQDMQKKKMFGSLMAWKVDSQELKEELRAMHG